MIFVVEDKKIDVDKEEYELVERKGIGHPDTLADAIAEKVSVNYCKYFFEKYGRFAHHWFDKVVIIGGEAEFEFGRGQIIKPYKIIFAGKCALFCGKEDVPIDKILFDSAKEVLESSLTNFDANKHMVIVNELVDYQGAGRGKNRYQPKAEEDLISINSLERVSNDCNLLSAYAPLSVLEEMVLEIERYINGKEFKRKFPQTGWDVKLVGCREVNTYKILINIPYISYMVANIGEYMYLKSEIIQDLCTYIDQRWGVKVELKINPQDDNEQYYLTVLGSVADTGDVGVVGRGNRINGLITPMRSMSIEAPAGKNPFDHTGKIYGYLAHKLADELYNILGKPVEVNIFTSKEAKLDEPEHVSVKIKEWTSNSKEIDLVEGVVKKYLQNIDEITKCFLGEESTLW